LAERPGERDERLGRTSLLPLAEEYPELERTLLFCRAAGVRVADGAERPPVSRRIDAGRRSRGDGVVGCPIVLWGVDRSRDTDSRRGRGSGADTATRCVTFSLRDWRLDACKEERDFFFPLDLGFAREPPLAFGRERSGFEGLARLGSDLLTGFVGLARDGADLPRGDVALGCSRVCRGLAIFL
jgi:hypothetical protein